MSHVEPRGLREAVDDEPEGRGRGVQCLGQFLGTAGLHRALHTLPQALGADLVCAPPHEGQESTERDDTWGNSTFNSTKH